ncbi:MAG: diacylglycerol/lipid kinase family protein [Gammaproteobacteria bacterium]
MRVTLIHNPDAGDEKQPTAGQIAALMKEAGYKVRYQSTKENGWQKALKQSADLVAVAGGDGTVGKVARRLIGSGVPIAVLPLGTANNVSKTLGIADLPITQLIPAWQSARRLKFDAGIATGPWGERYFVEGIGTGLLTCSIPELQDNKTIDQLKDTGIRITYAQQIFREQLADCAVVEIEAALDGADISGRYLLFEVLNMAYIGPNLFLAPDIVRNDGELDVVLLAEKHRELLHDHIKDWQEGKPWPPDFGARRGKRLKIKWTGFAVHIDDKLWPSKEKKKPKPPATIDIKVEPRAIEFLVPKEVDEEKKLAKENREKGRKKAGKSRKK